MSSVQEVSTLLRRRRSSVEEVFTSLRRSRGSVTGNTVHTYIYICIHFVTVEEWKLIHSTYTSSYYTLHLLYLAISAVSQSFH